MKLISSCFVPVLLLLPRLALADPPTTPGPAAPAASADLAPAPPPTEAPVPPDSMTPTPLETRASESAGHRGFVLVLSLGYSTPAGSATGAPNDALSSTFAGQVPLSIELGGNITPSVFLGAYATYAPGGVGSAMSATCTTDQLDCSSHSAHGGLAFRYRFAPGQTIEPWLGYAVGYESNSLSLTSRANGATGSVEITGWELGHFSAGLDFLAGDQFAFGPFVDLAVGQYGHAHAETPNGTQDADVTNTALHQWITVGLRSTFLP